MFVSFLVIFAVFTMVVYAYRNYRQPTGFEFEKVWVVSYTPPEQIKSLDSVSLFHDALRKQLRSMPQIENTSFCAIEATPVARTFSR